MTLETPSAPSARSDPSAPSSQQLRLRESQLFLALSIVVGILAGLAAVTFTLSIEWVNHLFFGLAPSGARLFLVPTLVSVVTGLLLATVFPDVRGSGVPQTEAAFHLNGGVIPARVPLGKFLTGVLCIGSGHSMGREGPSVQIGAGLASVIGRLVRLPPARVKELVPVGAAGALAAAFNTPVAAVIFALEEIIGDMNATLLGSTVVASVASVIVERSILGNEPLFRVPTYHLVHPGELAAYAALGVVGGVVSLAFCKALLGARLAFRRLPSWTRALQPAIGGAAIGALLLGAPQVMGVGYEYVDQALNGGMLFKTLVALCLLKLVATVISYSSGNAGGIFAPSLFIGAMAGGAVGAIVHRVAPFPTGDPGAYALVGMGTLFAGIIRAPMTSVFMIFEITQDYQILVPLMVANLLSFAISRRYQPMPVYHALLQQDGIHLPTGAAFGARPAWTARAMMRTDAPFVPADMPVDAALSVVRAQGGVGTFVGTPESLVGFVALDRLAAASRDGGTTDPVGSLAEESIVHVHPDHPFDVVVERFAQSPGLLPVVSRDQARRVEGFVTLDEVTRFVDQRRRDRRSVDEAARP
jgi:CIC family chloride channel protein